MGAVPFVNHTTREREDNTPMKSPRRNNSHKNVTSVVCGNGVIDTTEILNVDAKADPKVEQECPPSMPKSICYSENNSKRKPIQLSIAQWNGRSINSRSKINSIKTLNSNLTALQEIWQKENELRENFQILDSVERTLKRG